MATNKRRPFRETDGPPVKTEADFLITALKKGAEDINYTARQYNRHLDMVHPTKGLAVYFGCATEITLLLNYANKRCIELIEAIHETEDMASQPVNVVPPSAGKLRAAVEATMDQFNRVRVTKAPPIEDQPDPATVFGGEKARKAAEKRVQARRAKRRGKKTSA